MDKKAEGSKPLTTMPSMTLAQLRERFQTENDCKQFIKGSRWPDGVRCPRCGNNKVYMLKQPWKWQCHRCAPKGNRFSILTGTIFENTKYPLRTWFEVGFMITQSKTGISALQIHRQIGSGEYRTAWYTVHRFRAAMTTQEFTDFIGEVEIDETGPGGKDRNRHPDEKKHVTGMSGKTTVVGAISRKANVTCQMIERADAPTLNDFVRKVVNGEVDLVATDEHRGYYGLNALGYPHETVTHSEDEYVRGNVHTNSIDHSGRS
jgi:ISXO2-like transposase domain/Transposase zinc-ribbon domain